MLAIRVDAETKSRLSRAAQFSGKTLSQFVIDAATAAAEAVHARGVPSMDRPASGVPDLFRATCEAAHAGGSGMGYHDAGRLLTASIRGMRPPRMLRSVWALELRRLRRLVKSGDRERVLAWFDEHTPECVAMVPARRRPSFVDGVFAKFRGASELKGGRA